MTDWRIHLADLALGGEEIEAITAVLRSRWLTMGPRTAQFEAAFAEIHAARHAVAVSSCTAALHLAYLALNISAGDEVILPSLTFVGTANPVLACGARPVFGDIVSLDEPVLDPAHVAHLVTERTRAIVVVHYGGYPGRIAELKDLTSRKGIPLIEDCAHAPGVSVQSRFLGTWGTVGCFSFFSNKNMTTAEGGMVTTGDRTVAERVQRLRSHGMTSGTWKRHQERPDDYDVVEAGWNYRIDELRAALGLVQLAKLGSLNARRRQLTERYRARLANVPGLTIPFPDAEATAAHILPVVVENEVARRRVVEALNGSGVQTSHHYRPIHLFRAYRERFGFQPGMLPITEAFAARQITLPLHPGLTEPEIDDVSKIASNALHSAESHRR